MWMSGIPNYDNFSDREFTMSITEGVLDDEDTHCARSSKTLLDQRNGVAEMRELIEENPSTNAKETARLHVIG